MLLNDDDRRKRDNYVNVWTMVSTANALLFGAAMTALFAGTPPNPVLQLTSSAEASALPGHPYAVLWGLAGSLNLFALASCLLCCVWILSCETQEEMSSMLTCNWLLVTLSWLAAAVAYASLVYSLFVVYGIAAGSVALVPLMLFVLGVLGGCLSSKKMSSALKSFFGGSGTIMTPT
jgi:hypothetical protein